VTLAISGCPEAEEKRKEAVETVGGAAKRQLDQVEAKANASAKKAAERMKEAAKQIEEANKPSE